MIVILGAIGYLVIAAITGGVIHALKHSDTYGSRWGWDDSAWVGMGWPFSWVWYGIFKPIVKLSMRITKLLVEQKQVRIRVREEKQREERKRIAEVDEIMAREEQERHQARA